MNRFADRFERRRNEQARADELKADIERRGGFVGGPEQGPPAQAANTGPGAPWGKDTEPFPHGFGAGLARASERMASPDRPTLADRVQVRREMLQQQLDIREEQDQVKAFFDELEALLEENPQTTRILELMWDLHLFNTR